MNRIGRNVSIILRAERLMAQRRMSVLRTQTGLMAAAGVVAGVALIMLNVAAFYALNARMSPQAAALIVSLVNAALALILIVVASRMNAEEDVRSAAEVRDMAIEDIEAEFEQALVEIREVMNDIRQIARNPAGTLLPGLIGPLVSALMKSIRK